MAASKPLNAANLEALGAAQLASLLIEVSKGNAAAQRRLRLALAGNAGAAEAARAVLKRLTSISQSKTWLGWRNIKPLVAELEAQRRAILDLIAPSDPREAFELLWRLVGCAEPVLARSDDGSGRLFAAFRAAAQDLGSLAHRGAIHVDDLAGRAFRALAADRHGVWDELIPTLAPSLGRSGLTAVRELMQEWQAEPAIPPGIRERVIGRSRFVLKQIADALGDVEGYIAQIDRQARQMPASAAAIARRLLDARRLEEAWAALDAVDPKLRDHTPVEWDNVRVDLLVALGRAEEAQAFRWQRFSTTLDASHLRAHLRELPDFDDLDAEQKALTHALGFPDIHRALAFLVAWPDLQRASELVLGRSQALNGDFYEALSPAADALETRYPLAATVLRRTMIGFTLRMAKSSRYKQAAQQFERCRQAGEQVVDYGRVPTHAEFERGLRAAHGRKAGFWHELQKLA